MEFRDTYYSTGHDTLDPLDVPGLPPPFPNLNVMEHTPSLSDGTVMDETPTTATTSLPTPGHAPPFSGGTDFVGHSSYQPQFQFTVYSDEWRIQPPPAPRLKDMDSFTEGTAVGSFDISLRSSCSSEQLSGRSYFDAQTVRSSCSRERLSAGPYLNPEIELWRDEVSLSTSSELLPLPIDISSQQDTTVESSVPPPAFTSWQTSQARALKRHLSSSSLDDCNRGRKLRRGCGVFMPRFSNVSPTGSLRGEEQEVGHDRPSRSSSTPVFL
jgi:hypothetical protein